MLRPTAALTRRALSVVVTGTLVGALLVGGAAAPASAGQVSIGCDGQALRQAIVNSNASPGADTIRLTANCTYSFSDAYSGSWYGPAALPPIASDITIDGQG